jgi:porin
MDARSSAYRSVASTTCWCLCTSRLFIVLVLTAWSCASAQPSARVEAVQAAHHYSILQEFWRAFGVDLGQQYMTGSWGGLRDRLANAGLTATMTYTTDLLGNPIGGRQHGFRYTGEFGIDLVFDLEKGLGWKGLLLDVSGVWRSGSNLSARDIGNTFNASNIFGGETVRLYAIALEQSLFDDRLDIRVGRFGAGDEFMSSPLYANFVNAAFNINPGSIPINIPSFPTSPIATWGLQFKALPLEQLSIMGGVYDSDVALVRNRTHGVDFGISGDAGAFVIGEIGYHRNQGQAAAGNPGNFKIGGYYDTNAYQNLSNPTQAEIRGNYGIYLLLDQMAYREGGPESKQGLTPFAVVTVAPSDRNAFPFFCSIGLVYQGLIPRRDRDTMAVGLAYGKFSGALKGQDFEMILEWTYAVALAPWLTLQPDMQYVFKPGGTGDIPNAFVLGIQISLSL